MCLSAERDPRFGLYWEGCGVANAHLAEQNISYYPKAITTLDRASVLDPNWGTNYMNLAMVYARAGQYDLAVQILEVGIARAPQAAMFALNLGWVEEQRERGDPSQTAYHRALELGANPEALFWQQTSLRQKTLTTWLATKNKVVSPQSSLPDSLIYYQDLLKASAIYPEAYIGLAHTYWALGDNTQGDFYARQAMSIPVFVPFYLVDVTWLRAEYAYRHDDPETARHAGLEYFTQFYDYSFQGVGTWGYANYAWFGYRREGLPSDFVPQIIRADITPEVEERIIQLAEWYAADGKEPVACIMLDRVRREAPKSKSGELYNKRCHTSANN
jgi:tetratricopeptide (TPR) repeat protein